VKSRRYCLRGRVALRRRGNIGADCALQDGDCPPSHVTDVDLERFTFEDFTMINPVRLFLVLAGASALGVAALASAPAVDTFEIVIGNGPHAGSSKFLDTTVFCVRLMQQKQVGASYKDFDAKDLMKVGEASISISNPDDAGTKRGAVMVAFGARGDKQGSRYTVSIPDDSAGPLTLTKSGKGAVLEFLGKTKDGISLHVTATCTILEEL
jgi:hypothetical protein